MLSLSLSSMCGSLTPLSGMFNITGKYKYNAWKKLEGKSKDEAKAGYIALLKSVSNELRSIVIVISPPPPFLYLLPPFPSPVFRTDVYNTHWLLSGIAGIVASLGLC
jgi:hypothetical protein